jgi:tRNA A-37 threonylcarbamoyl transferase component Bud32
MIRGPMSETDDIPMIGVAATLTSGERSLTTGVGWSATTVDDHEDDLVGQTLCNTYVIERILGEGGMGRVYLARHTRIQRKRLAVKVLHPEYLRKPDIVRRFQREAEAAASIISERVVSVYDVDQTSDGRPFIVAELLDGIELGELLDREGRLGIAYAVGIVRQICDAMTAAHAQGVVHRDMKPENVFLTGTMERPRVKVLDFGISRLDDEGTKLTQAGTVMGTPAYMPPEQARGEHVDERADVYAVGAVLYRALTGHAPFERDDPMATMAAVFTEEPPRPRSFDPAIPEHLEAIIQRAMAKKREQRYANMNELSAALEPYDTMQGAPAIQAAGAAPARSAREARTQLVMLLSAAALAVLAAVSSAGVAVVHLVRGSGPSAAELAVAVGCLVLGAATPGFLAARRLRRTIWDNSARVLDAVEVVRRPLLAAVAMYGAGWLLVALLDALTLSWRAAWVGWMLLFALTAALAGAAAHFGRREGAPFSRLAKSPVLATATTFATLGVALLIGLVAYEPAVVAEGASSPARPTRERPASRVDADELAAAKKAGASALSELAARHPDDPAVLKALLIAQGEKSATLEEAMKTAQKLARVDDDALGDSEVVAVIEKAADSIKSRGAALDVMAEHMGEKGVDRLWELAHGSGAARDEAQRRLDDPKVRERGSAALRIACELEAAEGCAAKAALLDRVAAEGDERAAAHLRPLVKGSGRGCGMFGLGACPARCAAEAARMREAIAAIEAR